MKHSTLRTCALNPMKFVWLALLPLLAVNPVYATDEQVKLELEHGIYMVPVKVNQAVSIPFVLDSGASEVAIPADVFMTLIRSYSVSEKDFVGEGTFITADGTKHKSKQFILREVQVGTHVIKDVVADVVPIEGDPLLGQSFLSRLPSWSIDNNSHSLNLATGEAIQTSPEQTPALVPSPAILPPRGSVSTSSRYKRTNCGSIVDNRTGLEWFVGPDAEISWATARAWARGLDACGKQWGLPTTADLRSLFDKAFVAGTGYFTAGRYWPAHIEPIFSSIGGGSWVWAEGQVANGNAPAFNFNQGAAVRVSASHFYGTIRAFGVAR